MRRVPVAALTAEAFAPFGTVLEPGGESARLIRDGAVRLTQFPGFLGRDAAATEVAFDYYEVQPQVGPLTLRQAERHPFSDQLFVALNGARFLAVVWPEDPATSDPIGFVGAPGQAVIYRAGVWHHAIVAVEGEALFGSLIWRTGRGDDTVFAALDSGWTVAP
ncbi:MAG: ureidoglycolate hydrolase [Pseudooceanicola sp.]|jgi:ureidoglycolate lyase|nr:ureidoglycolate hydrolase [Pseudooceanicola sp.]